MNNRRVAGVTTILFDLDGTLVDSESAYQSSLVSVGFAVNDDEYLAARARVKERAPKGSPAVRNRLLYFKELLFQKNRGFSPRAVLELMDHYEKALEAVLVRQWIALGRPEIFKKLGRRFKMGIVTNENLRTQLLKARAIDPEGLFFKVIVTSEEVGKEKPAHEIFHAALESIGSAPEECLFVGNDYQADIEPALSMGMEAVLTREFNGQVTEVLAMPPACRTIEKLDDLFGVLDER